jgi:hypothetical protein
MIPPRFMPGRKVCFIDGDVIVTTTIVAVVSDRDERHRYRLAYASHCTFPQGELYLDYPRALTERERRAKTKQGSLQP